MTAEDYLRAVEALPLGGLNDVLPEGGVTVLAPHPDDESLGCGGLLALLAAAGRPIKVLVMSDGAGSHPASRQFPAPRLRAQRREEVLGAMAALGVPAKAIGFLDAPDGDVPNHGPRLEQAAQAVRDFAGQTTLAATLGLDPHKDHAATWAIARRAARLGGLRLLGYPVWSWRYLHPAMNEGLGPLPPAEWPGPPEGWRLDIGAVLPAKRRAVAAHRSQLGLLIDDDPGAFALSAAVLEVLQRPFEAFVEATATMSRPWRAASWTLPPFPPGLPCRAEALGDASRMVRAYEAVYRSVIAPQPMETLDSVPARNEEGQLPTLLRALAAPDAADRPRVLVLANNCTDGSAAVARAAAGGALDLRVLEQDFPAGLALDHGGRAVLPAAIRGWRKTSRLGRCGPSGTWPMNPWAFRFSC
jgi:LmbE family N-acetylglucosaminyl deacetylase